jgi:large conductance mechanosensitive channel
MEVMEMSTNEQMLEELKKIREALVPAPPPPPEKKSLWQEFKEFLDQYKVMGLAVAFIMALYLGRLIQALVNAWISPVINVVLLSIGLLSIDQVLLDPSSYPLFFNPTLFISELITFIIVALVIFILVKFTKRLGIK